MKTLWTLYQVNLSLQKKLYRYMLSGVLKSLGKDVDIHPGVTFDCPEKIIIEDRCRIGAGVRLIGGSVEAVGIHLGPSVRIRPYVNIYAYGGRVILGKRVSIGEGSIICGHGGLTVGENTMISWLCSIVPANHIFDRVDVPLRFQGEERLGIKIGSNVWIGSCTTILDGVTIGDHAVVGAGAVVTKDIPDYGVAIGVPAKYVRDRRVLRQGGRIRTPIKVPEGESMTDVDDISRDDMFL